MVFAKLEENAAYEFRVLANTSVGSGPWSGPVSVQTESDLVRPPINLRAMATSHSSAEVWWEQVHTATQIVGYQVRRGDWKGGRGREVTGGERREGTDGLKVTRRCDEVFLGL